MVDIRKICNPIVDLSKFTLIKKILSKIVVLSYDDAHKISRLNVPGFNGLVVASKA